MASNVRRVGAEKILNPALSESKFSMAVFKYNLNSVILGEEDRP
jgi:hypothetical protein